MNPVLVLLLIGLMNCISVFGHIIGGPSTRTDNTKLMRQAAKIAKGETDRAEAGGQEKDVMFLERYEFGEGTMINPNNGKALG